MIPGALRLTEWFYVPDWEHSGLTRLFNTG
jgi:hypothetical protein